MQCPACGAEVLAEAVYCHVCGERVDAESQNFAPAEQEGSGAAMGPAPDAAKRESTHDREPAARDPFRPRRDDDDVEEELWEGGYSSKAMIGAWAVSALVSIALLAIGAVWVRDVTIWIGLAVAILLLWTVQAARLLYRQWNIRYRLTTQRFIHQTGILRRVTDRIELIDVDDITFEQGLLERFVGVGTIRVSSSDRTHPEFAMPGIENVGEVAGLIDDARRTERRRRGLHIESV